MQFLYSVKEQMAVGYNVDGSVAPLISLGYEYPAGQMYSTTHDLDTVSLINCAWCTVCQGS